MTITVSVDVTKGGMVFRGQSIYTNEVSETWREMQHWCHTKCNSYLDTDWSLNEQRSIHFKFADESDADFFTMKWIFGFNHL